MTRKIASHYALIDGHLERNTIIEVDGRTITAIERSESIDNRAGVEFYSGILIAGMVDIGRNIEKGSPAHIDQTSAQGALMWQEGIEMVAEGYDYSTYSSPLERMLQRGNIAVQEALLTATRHGAEALGMEHSLGDIRVGAAPGIVLIEGADLHAMHLTPETRSRRII